MSAVYRFLTSLRTTIVLLFLIAAACVVGAVLREDVAKAWVYSSPWFNGLLLTLCAAIVTCRLLRLPARGWQWGSYLTHLSLILVLVGVVIGAFFGQDGDVRVEVGQTLSKVYAGEKSFDLPFSLRLDSFQIDYAPGERPGIAIVASDDKEHLMAPNVGATLSVPGTQTSFRVVHFFPDFKVGEDGGYTTASWEPRNPTWQIEEKTGDKTASRLVFALYPDYDQNHANGSSPFRLYYYDPNAHIDHFRSQVTVFAGGKPVYEQAMMVNQPLRWQGWTLYQTSCDNLAWTWSGFRAKKDPGVPIVYAGFGLILVGLTLVMMLNPRIRDAGRRAMAAPGVAAAPPSAVE